MNADERNPKFVWQDQIAMAGLRPYSTAYLAQVMSNRDNGDGRNFYLSVRSLARMGACSESVAERAIKQLMDEGWITRTRKGGRHGLVGRASTFVLSYPPGPFSQEGLVMAAPPQPRAGDDMEVEGAKSPPPSVEVLEVQTEVLQAPAGEVMERSQHPAGEVPVDQSSSYRPVIPAIARSGGEPRRSFSWPKSDEPPAYKLKSRGQNC